MKSLKILGIVVAVAVALFIGYSLKSNNMIGYGRTVENTRTVLDASATTTWGTTILVNDYRNIGFELSTNATSGTIKFACSYQNTAPTFSETASATNTWDYVETIDLEDGSSYDGDTGYVITNDTGVRNLTVNSNVFKWCTAHQTWTAGTTTIKLKPANNL